MRPESYRPRLSLEGAAVEVEGAGLSVPGCANLTIRGVRVLAPIRRLTAELEMRLGGSPGFSPSQALSF